MKKLNQKGLAHYILPVVIIAAIAGIGTYTYVASHALTPDVQPSTPPPTAFDNVAGINAENARSASATRSLISVIAISQLGSGYQKKYGDAPESAWCAVFATWTWRVNHVAIPNLNSAHDIRKWAKKHHRWGSKPVLGAIAVYGNDHVGVVAVKKGNEVGMVDGNWGGKVSIHLSDSGKKIDDYKNYHAGSQKITGFVIPPKR